jgi:DNA-3-methyladenine glycosylase
VLVRRLPSGERRSGRIVETEAYVGADDLASHAARGKPSGRASVMYGPPGRAYVYLIYGMHNCLNAVTEREGFPAAVLLRALEPLENVATRTDGPGRLCRALAIDRSLNGARLDGSELWVEPAERRDVEIASGPRIGVDYAGEWAQRPWRFWIRAAPRRSRTDRRR